MTPPRRVIAQEEMVRAVLLDLDQGSSAPREGSPRPGIRRAAKKACGPAIRPFCRCRSGSSALAVHPFGVNAPVIAFMAEFAEALGLIGQPAHLGLEEFGLNLDRVLHVLGLDQLVAEIERAHHVALHTGRNTAPRVRRPATARWSGPFPASGSNRCWPCGACRDSRSAWPEHSLPNIVWSAIASS